MALLPAFRHVLFHLQPNSSTTIASSIFPKLSISLSQKLSFFFSSDAASSPVPSRVPPKENTLVLNKDARLVGSGSGGWNDQPQQVSNSSTITAIVTSLVGPPAAVGIVRLSGPSAVGIVGILFRPSSKKKRRVQYGNLGAMLWSMEWCWTLKEM